MYKIAFFVVGAWLVGAGAGLAQTFSDGFSTGLNPTYWEVVTTTNGLFGVNAAQGVVEVAKTNTTTPGGLQAVTIRLDLAELGGIVTNDFAATVSFTNAFFGGAGPDQVEFHTAYEDGSIFFDSYDNGSGLNVHVWDGSAAQGLTPVATNAGTFSIRRVGSTVTGYFNGTALYAETRSSPLVEVEFSLQNNNGSDDSNAVGFLNFSLTSASLQITPPATGIFYPVSISNAANFSWAGVSSIPGEPTAVRLPNAPIGAVTLQGVPFNIASNAAGNQAWHGDLAANGAGGLVSMSNYVGVFGVTNVYSLINTWEGQAGPSAYAWLVFTGSAGTVYTNFLVGGTNIRDYNSASWENNISGASTVNVFGCLQDNWGTPGRLDMQGMALPAAFAGQTLVSIQLIDNGGPGLQRTVLDGLTVESAGAPLSIAGNGSGVTVYWPALAGAQLQTNGTLAAPGWVNYNGAVSTAGGTNSAVFAPATGEMFYRLRWE